RPIAVIPEGPYGFSQLTLTQTQPNSLAPPFTVSNGAQEMFEDPLGHALPLRASHRVRRAEVDANVDTCVNDLLGRVGEASIGARFLHGQGIRAGDGEGHFVPAEEEREHAGHRASVGGMA